MYNSHKYKVFFKPVNYFLFFALILFACKGMDEPYKDFLKDGERIYVGMPDSIKVKPGNNRLELEWLVPADPNISKAVVYWHNRASKVEVPIETGADSIKVLINDLQEGEYLFELVHYDPIGNRSMSVDTNAMVYGMQYSRGLGNRMIESITQHEDQVSIQWDSSSEGMVGVEVNYTDMNGVLRTVQFSVDLDSSILEQVDIQEKIEYRTLYKPEELSIDTFYSDFNEIILE